MLSSSYRRAFSRLSLGGKSFLFTCTFLRRLFVPFSLQIALLAVFFGHLKLEIEQSEDSTWRRLSSVRFRATIAELMVAFAGSERRVRQETFLTVLDASFFLILNDVNSKVNRNISLSFFLRRAPKRLYWNCLRRLSTLHVEKS